MENIDPKELKRQKARERYASMTEEQKAVRNAKRRENYHRKKVESQAGCMTPEKFSSYPVRLATNLPTETPVMFHPLGEGVDVQDQLRKNDSNTSLHDFVVVEPTIDKHASSGIDLSPEELKRERERNRYSNMSKLAIHEKVLKIQNIRRHNKVTTQASNPINRGEQGYSSEAATFGTSPTAVLEVLTRSKTSSIKRTKHRYLPLKGSTLLIHSTPLPSVRSPPSVDRRTNGPNSSTY